MDFENNYKKFLKDTGCKEDEAMSRKEMMEFQAAINNSKDTANLEEEKREYVRHAEEIQATTEKEKASTVKERSASRSPTDIFENQLEEQPIQMEFDITFHDMPESSGECLEIIYHKPIYALPIPFNPKYQKCSIKEKTKLLYEYHTKMSQLKTKLAKRSLRRAPFSKPIFPSISSRSFSLKHRQSEDGGSEEGGQISTQEFYVSRAGRQIKRKVYTEEPELDDNDFETSSLKRNKFSNSDTKITLDTPFVPEENHNDEKNNTKPKLRRDTPTKRALLPISTKKVGRSESIFDKLIENEEKRRQKRQEMENFEKTLPLIEEFEDEGKVVEDVQEAPRETSEENFVRKRVVPPIPGRRPGIRAKKQPSIEDFKECSDSCESPFMMGIGFTEVAYPGGDNKKNFDKIDVVQETPPTSPKNPRQYMNQNRSVTITKSNTKTPKPKEIKSKDEVTISKFDKTSCPICNKYFLLSEIEHHAANCGIEEEIEEFPEATSAKLRCELCEKEFMANTSYEVHVKECIASKIQDL